MSDLARMTVTFDGNIAFDRDVAEFSLEMNASGAVFIAASTQPAERDTDAAPIQPATAVDTLTDDDRHTPFERQILESRKANGTP